MRNILVVAAISLVFYSNSPAQSIIMSKLKSGDLGWISGKITDKENITHEGMINFNESNHNLKFTNGHDTITYTARTLLRFEIDGRKFYSFYFDVGSQLQRPIFCEILKIYDGFIVFTRKDPVELVDAKGAGHYNGASYAAGYSSSGYYTSTRNVAEEYDILYFSDGPGNMEPYLVHTRRYTEGLLGESFQEKTRMVNKKLIAKYTAERWAELKAYAKENRINLRTTMGVLDLLDYYDELLMP